MNDEMKEIRDLMSTGDIAAAAERLQARMALVPEDAEAKMLFGTCRHLLGDDEAFCRIDDELSCSASARALPSWPRFHALRVAAAGGALILAGALADLRAEKFDVALYGGLPFDRKQLVVPTPSASDGKYAGYVRVKWKSVEGANFYKVRRATSSDYSKSKVIATVTGTSYKDKHPATHPRKKYYYWIVPYVSAGQGRKDVTKKDSGYTKQLLNVESSTWSLMEVGTVCRFFVSGNKGKAIKASDCTWRIVSGWDCATISRDGVLMARKAGTVVVSVSYNGVTKKGSIYISKKLNRHGDWDVYAAPVYFSLNKVSGADADVMVMPLETTV